MAYEKRQHRISVIFLLALLLFGCAPQQQTSAPTTDDHTQDASLAPSVDVSKPPAIEKNISSTEKKEIAVHILHAGGGYDGLTLLNAQEPFSYITRSATAILNTICGFLPMGI